MQGTAREEIDSEIVAGRIEEPKAPFSSNPLEASTGKLTLIPPVAEPTGPPQEAGKLGFDPPAPRDGPDPAPIPIQGVETPAKSNHGSADPIPSLPSTPPIDGTTSAKEQPGMKKAEKMIKSAELTQQNLPGEASASATPQKTPGKLASPAQTSSLLAPNITANPNPAASEPTSAAPATSGPAVESRLLEQTREMIVSHAVRLHQSGTDTLRVVIQPGGGVELALELRQLNDGIQAQAVLHRGDFQQLSEHWSELQQRLAPTGVQLSALQPPASTAGTGQQFPTPERHRSHQQQSPRNAIAEAAFGGAMTEPPAPRRVRAKTYRGWESWA